MKEVKVVLKVKETPMMNFEVIFKNHFGVIRHILVAECLPRIHKALGSIPAMQKQNHHQQQIALELTPLKKQLTTGQ